MVKNRQLAFFIYAMSQNKNDITSIDKFISENKIAAICCTDKQSNPYCFHCFYVFDSKNHLLFFKSSSETFHARLLLDNPGVAGSILPEKIEFLALKGIQFTGKVLYDEIPDKISPEAFYYKRLPLGLTKPGKIYCIQLESIKLTDNSVIFGKKFEWTKEEVAIEI